jgi:hypothetical protein
VIIVIGQMIGWRTWVRPWIQLRREVGAYHALMRELEQEDQRGFKNSWYNSTNLLMHMLSAMERQLWREQIM